MVLIFFFWRWGTSKLLSPSTRRISFITNITSWNNLLILGTDIHSSHVFFTSSMILWVGFWGLSSWLYSTRWSRLYLSTATWRLCHAPRSRTFKSGDFVGCVIVSTWIPVSVVNVRAFCEVWTPWPPAESIWRIIFLPSVVLWQLQLESLWSSPCRWSTCYPYLQSPHTHLLPCDTDFFFSLPSHVLQEKCRYYHQTRALVEESRAQPGTLLWEFRSWKKLWRWHWSLHFSWTVGATDDDVSEKGKTIFRPNGYST